MSWLIFSLLNAFFHSISAVIGKRGAQKLDVYSTAWAQSFFGLFIIIPLTVLTGSLQPVNHIFWVALFLSSVLHVVAIILYFRALKDSPISLVMPVLALTPVFLLITSPLIVGEFPTLLGIIGILTTVIGSYVLNLSKRSRGLFEPLISIVREKGTREMFIVAFIWSIASNTDKIGVLLIVLSSV